MVAILILLVAILPMFKMFDVGLRTATTSRNYDLAQSLAEKQAELVQANAYTDIKNSFPNSPALFSGITGCGTPTGSMGSAAGQTVSGCKDSAYNNFTFSVNKRYVKLPASGGALEVSATDEKLLQVTISVTRAGETTPLFTTSGVAYE